MNKIFKFTFVAVLLISLLSVLSFADFESSYTFFYENREITIESTHISEEEAHIIADYIAYGVTPIELTMPGETLNTPLLCILFGHSIETYYARETIHNVYTTSPKCVVNRYNVEHCTRSSCDYIQKTLIDSTRTSECHG